MDVIKYLTILYFMVNSYLAGTNYDEWRFCVSKKDKAAFIITALFFFRFGILLFVFEVIWAFLKLLYDYQVSYTQLAFWWRWYLTKDFDNLDSEQLEQINKIDKLVCNTDSFKHRHFRKCSKLVFERNNYTPKEIKN